MFYRIRKRLTYMNVVATLALVFAMSGGAYAASRYVITSTKQVSPKVLKALAGKSGPTGPAGPAGAVGPAGPAGAIGPAGAQGAEGHEGKAGPGGAKGETGENVTGKIVPTSNTSKCGGQGGEEYTVAAKTTLICNGQTGFTSTLPQGKQETGVWGVAETASAFFGGSLQVAIAPIAFTIPLPSGLTSDHIYIISFSEGKGAGGGTCPTTSSVNKPEAEEGNLCIFEGPYEQDVAHMETINPANGESNEAGTTGTTLHIEPKEESKSAESISVSGTWAVTAP